MSLPPGTRLGPYEVTAAIGAGGMGEVYRGRDATLNRDVAIKVLPGALSDDAERLARFKREAQVLASLNHSNISHVYGFEAATLADGSTVHFLAMELVEGEDLSERLRRGAIPLDEAIAIAKQIALGLEEAHERGIIHRDLKPANIKLTPDGKVKILDFGLAKALEGDASVSASDSRLANSPTVSRHMTEAGMIMGTAAYMSPEQARGKAVDKRADIWSFGVVLFEMLTGRRLFAGETVSDTLAAVLKTDPDWNLLPKDAPSSLRALLKRCLERDPRMRWHDIADARILIEDRPASEPSGPLPRPSTGLSRRKVLVAAAVLVPISIAAGLVGYGLSRRSVPAPAPVHLAIELTANQELGVGGNSVPAFSPDGSTIVFPGRQDGRNTLFKRDLGSRESVPLEGTDGGTDPFFSPDGHWIGFAADGRLRKVAIEGGRPFPLAEATSNSSSAWLEDGTIVYTPIYSSGLYRVSSEGGSPEHLTTPDRASGELGHWTPDPLPGGRFVLFTAFRTPIDRSRVGVLDLKTRAVRWLVDGAFHGRYVSSGHLVFGRGTRLYAMPFDPKTATVLGPAVPVLDDVLVSQTSGFASFAVSGAGTLAYITQTVGDPVRELVWMDRAGREAPVTSERRRYLSVSLSPDGAHAALAVQGESQDLWTLALDRGTLSRLTSSDATEYGASWANDGRDLFYVVDRPPFELWRMAAGVPDSGKALWNEPPLFDTNGIAVSPDGRTIAFLRLEEETGSNIYSRPIDGSEPARPIRATKASERSISFSPDGRFVSYQSSETGRGEIYAQSFPGGEDRVQLSADGGTDPLWARNGEIFYRHDDDVRVITPRRSGTLEFQQPRTLFRAALSTLNGYETRGFDVTRDGSRILGIRIPEANRPRQVEIVTNWTSELGRLAPPTRD